MIDPWLTLSMLLNLALFVIIWGYRGTLAIVERSRDEWHALYLTARRRGDKFASLLMGQEDDDQ